MERKQDRNRRLADYIYNDMNPEEVVEMEREISHDPELSVSIELNMQVKDYLQAKIQLEEMKADPQLENAEKLAEMAFENASPKEMDKPVRRPGRKLIRNIAFASAVAAGITIIIAIALFPSNLDQDQLFASYYTPFEASDYSQRGVSNEIYRDVAVGINYYVAGNYNQTIDQFSQLASEPTLESEVQFFTALSYLGLGEYRSAQGILQSIDGANRYQAETLWYLSLCCLKTGEFEEANMLLGQLEAYDGKYKKDAQALRKKLRRFTP